MLLSTPIFVHFSSGNSLARYELGAYHQDPETTSWMDETRKVKEKHVFLLSSTLVLLHFSSYADTPIMTASLLSLLVFYICFCVTGRGFALVRGGGGWSKFKRMKKYVVVVPYSIVSCFIDLKDAGY